MIEVQSVSFSYSKKRMEVSVLDSISAQFSTGTVSSIYGPSGSGKTTLLYLLGGLEVPQQGKVLFDGEDASKIGYDVLRESYVAYIFQNYHLFHYLTAIENILVVLDPQINKKNKISYAEDILSSLQLNKSEMYRKVKFLSGGQQQRVAIARCIAKKSQYVLADEPTGNLDSKTSEAIVSILVDLAKVHRKCIIIATHSEIVKSASDFCFNIVDKKLHQI